MLVFRVLQATVLCFCLAQGLSDWVHSGDDWAIIWFAGFFSTLIPEGG